MNKKLIKSRIRNSEVEEEKRKIIRQEESERIKKESDKKN